jgi:hypothetical protein
MKKTVLWAFNAWFFSVILVIGIGCNKGSVTEEYLSGRVVEEYSLVYPEWEYESKGAGCPYRFSGIKVTIDNERSIYIVSEAGGLPTTGNTLIMKESDLPQARIIKLYTRSQN